MNQQRYPAPASPMYPQYPATLATAPPCPPPPPPGPYWVDEYRLHESPAALVCPTCRQHGTTIIEVNWQSSVKDQILRHVVPYPFRLLVQNKQRLIESVKHFCQHCRHYFGSYRPQVPLGALGGAQRFEQRERKEEERERKEEERKRKEEKRERKEEKRERKEAKRERREEKRERKEEKRERKEEWRQLRKEERHFHRLCHSNGARCQACT